MRICLPRPHAHQGDCPLAPRWTLRLMGLFVPVLRENDEMMYQFEFDYRFDSSKIEAAYSLAPTPAREGIATSLGADRP